MDVWQLTIAVLRRWYVFLPLLAVVALAAVRVGDGVAPAYESRATAILVPGTVPSEIENPYGSMDQTSVVLGILLDDAPMREEFAAQGLDSDYEVRPRTRSRIVDVIVLNEDSDVSVATAQAVLDRLSSELSQRQADVGIEGAAQIGLQVLNAPSITDVVTEGKLRNMAVVGVVGAALALLVSVLFDDLVGLIARWRRRRAERKAGPAPSADADADPGTDAGTERAPAASMIAAAPRDVPVEPHPPTDGLPDPVDTESAPVDTESGPADTVAAAPRP